MQTTLAIDDDLLGKAQAISGVREKSASFREALKAPFDPEVLTFIGRKRLYRFGIGYVDAHLLAAIRLTPGASLWTRDRRLHETAVRLCLAATRMAG
jgi:hypothetical protein